MTFKEIYSQYAVHDEEKIKGFFGEYFFLSNFYETSVYFEGILYPSSEHAYMAGKSLDNEVRLKFSAAPPSDELISYHNYYDQAAFLPQLPLTPAEARKLGQAIALRPDWNEVRFDTMLAVVFDKFWRNKELRKKLLDTGNKYLEETNHWKDKYWGVYTWTDPKFGVRHFEGENNLGKVLMKVRECLR